jgi:hypothetical protein
MKHLQLTSPSLSRGGLALLLTLICAPTAALATENGATAFPSGVEDFLSASMPPPGLYDFVYYNLYKANTLAGNDGDMVVDSFHLRVNAVTDRVDWVKPVSILGADRWGTLFLLPWVDVNLSLSPVPGVNLHGSKSGIGDMTIGNGLHWTLPNNAEEVLAFDVGIPTGAYEASDLANIGLNHWVLRLNNLGTWRPAPAWELSYRFHTDFNFKNTATDYTSGQTVYLNWAAGWKPVPPLTLGISGYFLRQVTDDHQHGLSVGPDGNRVAVDGIGPCIKYFLPNHAILTAKFYHEFDARNRPMGNQLWLYVIFPFGIL